MKEVFKDKDLLLPVIVQDANTRTVLMLAYMNKEAYQKTKKTGFVCFYSRRKKRLWTKGEESGNTLKLVSMDFDCGKDAILLQAIPSGPTCYTGKDTCWGKKNKIDYGFFSKLEKVIKERQAKPSENSYTSKLFAKGVNKIAKKVGEEAVELIIEAKDNNDDLFLNEAADLFYYYLVLLRARGYKLKSVSDILEKRHSDLTKK